MNIEHKIFEAEVKESNEKDLTIVHFISTEKRDRGRDILYADGMKVEGRPVVLFQHGWSNIGSEPIAKPLWIKKGEFKNRKGIQAKTQFFPDELGQRLWKKTTEGYMPNWSVGWRPLRHEYITDKDGIEVRHVYEWELLEYSLVAVPMQPDAQTLPDSDRKDRMPESILVKMLPEEEERRGNLMAWKRDDGTWEEKPYPNEHACRLEDMDKYIRIRRENDKFAKGIHAIWGIQGGNKPVELQAIRFDKTKYTVAEARKWLKDHDYKCKLFEPASEKCAQCGKPMIITWDVNVSGEDCIKTCDAEFRYTCECNEKKETGSDIEKMMEMMKECLSEIERMMKKMDELMEDMDKFFDHFPPEPDGEKQTAKNIISQKSPEPRQVLIITEQDKKQEEEQRRRQMLEALQPAVKQFNDVIERIPAIIKEELDRERGRVK